MKPNPRRFSSILSVLSMILLLGCSGLIAQKGTVSTKMYTLTSEMSSAQLVLSETIEPSPTPIPLSTPLKIQTAAFTSSPQPTGSPTIMWTPIATYSPTQALEKLLEFFSNNGGCELPCLWGITPGKTNVAAMLSLLRPLGTMRIREMDHGITRYTFEFTLPPSIDPFGTFGPAVLVKNDMVVAIIIDTSSIASDFDYSLAGILKELGQPEEIWLKVTPKSQIRPHYEIRLFYPSFGIEVGTHEFATLEEDSLRLCPQEIFNYTQFPPGMLLWSPEERMRFEDLPVFAPNLDVSDFRLLEDLTDEVDTQLFYETYRDPKTKRCFHIPFDRFPGFTTPVP